MTHVTCRLTAEYGLPFYVCEWELLCKLCCSVMIDLECCCRGSRVPTGHGKLENIWEFDWSGKVGENAKLPGKWEKSTELHIAG